MTNFPRTIFFLQTMFYLLKLTIGSRSIISFATALPCAPKAEASPCAKSKDVMRHETTRPDGASHHEVKICTLSREGALQQTRLFKEQHNPISILMPVTRLRLLQF